MKYFMRYVKNLIAKLAMPALEKVGYDLPRIVAWRYKAVCELEKEWSESAYCYMKEARKLAESTGHCFEELLILLDEAKYLLRYQKDVCLYYEVNLRLNELHKVFGMSDEDFRTKYQEVYWNLNNTQIHKLTDKCLIEFYDAYRTYSDYMMSHLNYSASILCGKAMNKIAVLTEKVPLNERVEGLLKMAIDYGGIRELDKAMGCYNEAIRLAQDAHCVSWVYIAILRKLSICLGSAHLTNHVNLDLETMSSIKLLLDYCDDDNPYLLGEQLVQVELHKMANISGEEKKAVKYRIERLCEAMPMMYLLLALSRGDWQTAQLYVEELKENEHVVYGGNLQYNNAEMILQAYVMLYDSEERSDLSSDSCECDETPDEPYHMPFPDGMSALEKHRVLMMAARNEMLQKHQKAAHALSEQAIGIAKMVNSDYHIAMSLHAIGQSFEAVDNVDAARLYYQMVAKMLKEPEHPGSDVKLSDILLFSTLLELGNLTKESIPKESVEVLSEAIELMQEKKNDQNYFLQNALLTRAIAKDNMKDIAGKEHDCDAALVAIIEEAKMRLPFMDRELRENYWCKVSKQLGRVTALLDEDSSPSLRLSVYEAILMAKGFLLSSERAERAAVYNEDSLEEFRPLYNELELYETSKQPWGTMTENSADKYVKSYMKSMKLMSATNGVIGKYYDFMNIKYSSILDSMASDEIIVDYYDYSLSDGDRQYIAFVYSKESEAPSLVKVCKESELKSIFNEVTNHRYEDGTPFHISEAYNPIWPYGASLYDLIVKKVFSVQNVQSCNSIYFVPSGTLHKLPIESLVVENNSRRIVSDYCKGVMRISHVKTLLRGIETDFNSIALFGGLSYGMGDDSESPVRGYAAALDNNEPTPLLPWSELQNSLSEVENIASLWEITKDNRRVKIYSGCDGTAESFHKEVENGCSVLHLATHGFFETMKSKENIPALKDANKPMDLTGLIMSNGNVGWMHGNSLNHEGVLTATDIARMDLSNTKLAVLSACYTGAGVVKADGVFGLQRAFKKAGADALVMSLWGESDEVGAQFMRIFYSYLLSGGMDRRAAFGRAKNEIRNRFSHPLFWANFIMID